MVEQVASVRAAGMTAAHVAAELQVDPRQGLDAATATRRRTALGSNVIVVSSRGRRWRRWLSHLAEPMTYLLLAATALSLVVWWLDGARDVPIESIVIVSIVIINAVWGGLQQARAERAVAALQALVTPMARVLRSGAVSQIPVAEVVPGDVLVLRAGDAVPADARLIRAEDVLINEASLTGESAPVPKDHTACAEAATLGDRFAMVHRGTTVVRGQGTAIVTSTGSSTELGHVAKLMVDVAPMASPLQRDIQLIGRMLARAVVVVALVLLAMAFSLWGIQDLEALATVIMFVVAVAVAAVPEGLPTILTVILAFGVQAMSRRNAIVTRLTSVEALGSATVICADKTGTLTSGQMAVQVLVTPDSVHREVADRAAQQIILGSALANSMLADLTSGDEHPTGDPTDLALIHAARDAGVLEECQRTWTVTSTRPFTRDRRLMSVVAHHHGEPAEHYLLVKGAPEEILQRCTHLQRDAITDALTDSDRARIVRDIESLMDDGVRVLAVADRIMQADSPHDVDSESGLRLRGLIGLGDPPRPGAAEVIASAQRAGIRTIMITGDHPRTAQRIARDLGIPLHDHSVVTGMDMDRLEDDDVAQIAAHAGVFARVTPEHKLRIVRALQRDGEVVAMTGDGVNDAPALRAADIGVAMGRGGTDAARQAATLILADDDIATVVAAIRHGRGIVDNIRTFLTYLVACNWGEVLAIALGVVAVEVLFATADHASSGGSGIVLPLLATQILWINLLTDAAPALALGMIPASADVMNRPPRGRREPLMDRVMWRQIVLIGPAMACAAVGVFLGFADLGSDSGGSSLTHARTGAFTVIVLAHVLVAVASVPRPWRQRVLLLAVGSSVALQIAVVHVPALNRAFGTTPLTSGEWAVCALAALFPAAVALLARRRTPSTAT